MTVRLRLVVAFVLVTALVTGLLAVGSYLVVANSRRSESVDAALQQARANLRIAATARSRDDLLAAYTAIGGFTTAGRLAGVPFRSSPFTPGSAQVPAGLVATAAPTWARTTLGGVPYLVVAARTAGPGGSPMTLDFFFSESQLQGDLDQLRNVLAGGWLAALVIAGIAGYFAARRTLRPVSTAADAARSMAGGALDTRLGSYGSDEFGRFATAFNEMADALEAKIDDLDRSRRRERRFTADVAHELRTPLTALVGEAEYLQLEAQAMGPDGRRLAAMMVGDVARLRRLVDELIEISRADAGSEPVAAERVDVGMLVLRLIRANGWSERIDVSGEAVVQTDERRLERIVANLLENAVEHTTGPVEVTLGGADGAVLAVSDHGEGIAAEHVPHLFERFYKADSARSGGGSGLGLAIAAEHAAAIGAAVDVQSAPGRGSVFTLTLPVAEPLPSGGRVVA